MSEFWIACPTIEDIKQTVKKYKKHSEWLTKLETDEDIAEFWNRYRKDTALNIVNDEIYSFGSIKNLPLWGTDEYYIWTGEWLEGIAIATDTRTTAQRILDLEKELHDLKEVRRLEEEKERIKKTTERAKEFAAIQNAITAFNEKWGERYELTDIPTAFRFTPNTFDKMLERFRQSYANYWEE